MPLEPTKHVARQLRWTRFFILVALALVAVTSLATSLDPTPILAPENDPVLGRWRWFNSQIKIFQTDGTVVGEGLHGTWKRVANGTPPKYEINWEDKFVDTLEGGKVLNGKNQRGHAISGVHLPAAK